MQLNVLTLFFMSVETIGEAYALGWRVIARCAWGSRDGMKRVRACIHSAQLDLRTLVWTRGASFPLAELASRLKCPRCGSRRVTLLFDVPKQPVQAAGRR